MSITARDIMQTNVHSVSSETSITDLERAFLQKRVTGFPVVDQGELVGIVSRSDIVRQLCAAQTRAEEISDYYRDVGGFGGEGERSVDEIADQVGEQIENLRVKDFMVRDVITVAPDAGLVDVSRLLVERAIHRLVVTEGKQLVGIITSTDVVRLAADGRIGPTG